MSFNLNKLDEERQLWIRTGLEDMEIQVKHSGPGEQERFRARMVRLNILKQTQDGVSIKPGKSKDFFFEYAKQYVTDWRNLIVNDQENPEFDVKAMGSVLEKSDSALSALKTALEEESDFLSVNGSGSSA